MCLSIDWLVNNVKYSIQSTGETLNKIVTEDIVTSTNCNGGIMKNVVYCDSSYKYIK